MPQPRLTLLLLGAFTASAVAQTDRVLPAGYETVWAGNNGTGVGYTTQNGISHNLYVAPFTAGVAVHEVAFRRAATGVDFPGVTVDFEILLSSTTADLTTLSSTFASNLGADATVVLPRQLVNVPARAANSSPMDWVGLPTTPWTFNGPNLLIQCKSYGTGSVNAWRMDRCFEYPNNGEAITWGRSCSTATVNSSGGSPAYTPGTTTTFSLAGAAANQPAFAFLGFDLTLLLGAIPLPVDLTPWGITGCTLLVDMAVTIPTATNASGAASVSLPIPGAGVTGLGFGMQWVYVDPAAPNPLQLLTTAGRLVHIGPLLCKNRYVYSLSNVNATTGTVQAGGPIARVRTVP